MNVLFGTGCPEHGAGQPVCFAALFEKALVKECQNLYYKSRYCMFNL